MTRPATIEVHDKNSGFTLSEILIATAIGALLVAVALQVLVRHQAALHTTENIVSLEERAAFALGALEADIRMAGYWGPVSNNATIEEPADLAIRCRGTNVTAWALQTATPVSSTDASYNLPCAPFSSPVPGSDTLTLRYANPVTVPAAPDRVQLHTGYHAAEFMQAGQMLLPPSSDSRVYNVAVHAWYVDQRSSEAGLPALRRHALVRNGIMQNQEIMPGVEDMQVTLGVDRDGDGRLDGFMDADELAPDTRVKAVRFWLLVRSAKPEPGHTDNGPWFSIDTGEAAPRQPGDSYRRISAERTIWLRNSASD